MPCLANCYVFRQVISLDVRTNLSSGVGVTTRVARTATDDETIEIRYVHILNRVLPPMIRVLAWCPVDHSFSARFSCTSRTYKYFFPRGQLDVDLMRSAARLLIGEHDFRNLCKMDVGNGVVNYRRAISQVDLTVSDDDADGYEMCELTIVGQAFLWHQIRCIVSILFLVGQQREPPAVVSELLDVERRPRKPQYTMASEVPLVLFSCCYDNCDFEWLQDEDRGDVVKTLQTLWTQAAVRQTVIRRMLQDLTKESSCSMRQQADCLVPGNQVRNYKPLFDRQLCESLEDRVHHYSTKRRRVR